MSNRIDAIAIGFSYEEEAKDNRERDDILLNDCRPEKREGIRCSGVEEILEKREWIPLKWLVVAENTEQMYQTILYTYTVPAPPPRYCSCL